MRTWEQTWLIGLLALSGACPGEARVGGQSGGMVDGDQPDIGGNQMAPACECARESGTAAVIGTLEQLDGCGTAAVRVEELLGGEDSVPAEARVEVGAVLEGHVKECGEERPLQPGDEVLALYSPVVPASAGEPPSPPQIFLSPLGAPIRPEYTEEDLPQALDAALELLLDPGVCKAWVEARKPPPPMEEEESEGGPIDPNGLMPITPADPAASSGPGSSGPSPEDEAPEDDPGPCGR